MLFKFIFALLVLRIIAKVRGHYFTDIHELDEVIIIFFPNAWVSIFYCIAIFMFFLRFHQFIEGTMFGTASLLDVFHELNQLEKYVNY